MKTANQNSVTTLTTTEESIMNVNMNPSNLSMSVNSVLTGIDDPLLDFNPEGDSTVENVPDFASIVDEFIPQPLSDHLKVSIDAAKEAREKELYSIRRKALRSAARMVAAVEILHNIGKDTEIGKILLSLAVTQKSYLRGKQFKNSPNSVTKVEFITESLDLLHKSNTAKVLKDRLNKAYKFLNDYTHNPDELVVVLKDKTERTRTLIEEYKPSANEINLSLRDTGVMLTAPKDSVLVSKCGKKFKFYKKVSITLGVDILNSHIEETLRRVQIHDTYGTISHIEETKSFVRQAYIFNPGVDTLALFLVLKENSIDIKTLIDSVKTGNKKLLILTRKENHEGKMHTLSRLSSPAINFQAKYGKTGVVSSSEAAQGYVAPLANIPRLVEVFKDHEDTLQVRLRENANKTVSRIEKLNNAKVLWSVKTKVFLIEDCTLYSSKLQYFFVGGAMAVYDDWSISNGACRVVTNMEQGGVKAATASFKNLDENLRKGDVAVISAAAFKGGLISAIGCGTGKFDWIDDLSYFALTSKATVDGVKAAKANLEGFYNSKLKPFLTTMTIGEEEVKGYMLELDLNVTNPYTVDSFVTKVNHTYDNEETIFKASDELAAIIENGEKDVYGLRGYVSRMKAKDSSFKVMPWIKQGLKDGVLSRKSLKTNVTVQEIQSAYHWFNADRAEQWVNDLLENQLEAGIDVKKVYACQYLGGVEKNIEKVLEVQDVCDQLLSLHAEIGYTLQKSSPVYNKSIIKGLLPLFTVDNDFGWIKLIFPNGEETDLPAGSILLGDIKEQLESSNKSYIISKGLITEVLEALKGMFDDHNNFISDRRNALELEMHVQARLLGKTFGYQETKGYYGVVLPLIGINYDSTFCGITNRERLLSKDADVVEHVTISKPPANFDAATAKYRCVNIDFGDDLLNLAFECAIFITPTSVMMYLNDFDGDLARISKGKSLRMVTSLYSKFHGKYFAKEVEGELEGNRLKAKTCSVVTLEEYHKAVYDAVKAKENVGGYTANSYFYEAMMPNIINKTLPGFSCDEFKLTNSIAYKACAILKILIQLEAMDNMKQEGSDVFLTELLKYWELRKLNKFSLDDPKDQYKAKVKILVPLLNTFVNNLDMEVSEEEVVTMVEAMMYCAVSYDTKLLKGFSLFNARTVNYKAFDEIKSAHTTGNYEGTYNYADSYEEIVNGVDQKSMYVYLIKATVEVVNRVLAEGLRIKGTTIGLDVQ